MAHVQLPHSGLWVPENLAVDKVSSQKMFMDNINKMESNYTGIISTLRGQVADITTLKDVDTTDSDLYKDGTLIFVTSSGMFTYLRNSTDTSDDTYIVTPSVGGGRWKMITNVAYKLKDARTMTLNGDVSGSADFDGSNNITITVTVADDSHNHVISNIDDLQTTLNLKAPLDSPVFTGTPSAPTANVDTSSTQLATTAYVLNQLAAILPLMNGTAVIGTSKRFARADHVHPIDTSRAPLNSPGLTGIPTAPTATSGTNTTQLATTAFVAQAIANLVASSPAALDTLNELATALGDDPNFATTMSTQLGLKAPLASPGLTGTPTAPTAGADTSSTQLATTAFVLNQLATVLPLVNGTAAVGTSKRFARADHVHPQDANMVSLSTLHSYGVGSDALASINNPLDLTLKSGKYYAPSGATNVPPRWYGGIVEVIVGTANTREVIAYSIEHNDYDSGRVPWSNIYCAPAAGGSSVWNGWSTNNPFTNFTQLNSGDDLNYKYKPGYYSWVGPTGGSLLNSPTNSPFTMYVHCSGTSDIEDEYDGVIQEITSEDLIVYKRFINSRGQVYDNWIDDTGTTYTSMGNNIIEKHTSGYMKIYGRKSFSGYPVNTPWGGMYDSGSSYIMGDNFPVPFIDIPYVTFGLEITNGGAIIEYGAAAATSNSPGGIWLARGATSTLSGNLMWTAIGRWR